MEQKQSKALLEVLVVEDNPKNKVAAQTFFDTQEGMRVDFATTYEEGLRRLQENIYAAAIFDLELPRKEGNEPERLGFELGEEAKKLRVPFCILTGGFFHHGLTAKIYPMGDEALKENAPAGIEKTDPHAWEMAYQSILNICPNPEEIVAAKRRYQQFIGKQYREG